MTFNSHACTKPTIHMGRPPWLVFLFLTVVFFFVYHDLSFSKNGTDNYNPSEDDLTAAVVEGSPTRRIALLSLGLYAIVSLIRHRTGGRLQIHDSLGWILLGFVAWASVSAVWAEDPALTLRRLFGFGVLCIAAVAVTRSLTIREIVLWTLFSTTLFLAIGFSGEVLLGIFRPFASGYRFAGTLHPNGQGINCVLLVLSGVAAADMERDRQRMFHAFALVGFVFLILTESRTSIAAAVLALAVYFTASWSKRAKVALVYVLGIFFCLFLLVMVNASLSGLKSAVMLGRDDASAGSFNGRTGIWNDVGYYVDRRPILGYGYGGFWTPTHISEISDKEEWGIPNGHSAYLDNLLTLGAVGLVGYVLLLFAGIVRAFHFHRLSRDSGFAFFGAFLVFCALDGLLESATIDASLPMFLSTVVLAQLAFVRPALPGGVDGKIA